MGVVTTVIKVTGDSRALQPTIDDLVEMGVIDAKNASQFKKNNAQFQSGQKKNSASIDSTNKQMKKTDGQVSSLSNSFNRLGLAIAGAFAVNKIAGFAREMSSLASTLEVTSQRMDVVFGSAAQKVTAESQKMATALGLSNNEFNLMSTQVGDVLVPLGLSRDAAAAMSTDAVKLEGALAEFSAGQVTTEQAVDALKSAFTGEREALKTLGVVISEADVSSRLYAKGQDELTGAALSSAKAQATLELITERSADAQTFFAQNSDSLIRKQKELEARTQTLREELAEKLAPVIRDITEFFLDFFNSISIEDIIKFAKGVGIAAAAFVAYRTATKGAAAVQKLFSQGIGLSINPLGLLSAALTAGSLLMKAFGDNASAAEKAQQAYNEATIAAEASAAKEIVTLELLLDKAQDVTRSTESRQKALDEIKEAYPEYLGFLELETINSEKAAKAIDLATESIRRKAKEQAFANVLAENEAEILQQQFLIDELRSSSGLVDSARVLEAEEKITALRSQQVKISKELKTLNQQDQQSLNAANVNSGRRGNFFGALASAGVVPDTVVKEEGKKSKNAAKQVQEDITADLITEVEKRENIGDAFTKKREDQLQRDLDEQLLQNKRKFDNEEDLRRANLDAEITFLQASKEFKLNDIDERIDLDTQLADKKEELRQLDLAREEEASKRRMDMQQAEFDAAVALQQHQSQIIGDIAGGLTQVFLANDEERADSFKAFVANTLSVVLKDLQVQLQASIFKAFATSIASGVPLPIALLQAGAKTALLQTAFAGAQAAITAITFHDGTEYVPGGGGPGLRGDETWAKLQQGEGIAHQSANRKYAGLIKAMNEGSVDRWFAENPNLGGVNIKDARNSSFADNVANSLYNQLLFDDSGIKGQLKKGMNADADNTKYLAKVFKESLRKNYRG